MKYTTDVVINLPRDRVIELFDSEENLKEWQSGLVSMDLIDGEAGQPGARSTLVYDMKGRRLEMVETVEERELPDSMVFTYKAKNVWNRVVNRFIEQNSESTQWVAEHEFRCRGFMAIMAFLIPGAFRKQSCSDMDRFKAFAEKAGPGGV